jgi:capsular polysaccharide biosynthesis protein
MENQAIASSYTSRKMRKLEPHQTGADIVTRLRNAWPGRIYTCHLKHRAVVRWVVRWIWRNGYLNLVNLSAHLFISKAKRWRSLIKLSDFVQKHEMPTYKLADDTVVETPAPIVFPLCDQSFLVSPHDRYIFPEIFVATIRGAMTFGGTNLILADNDVIRHDLFDFERDYTSEELHGRTLIDPKSSRVRWLLHDKMPEPIPVAATFVDACASNYAHWMTEVLPRIAMFCAEDRFHGVPVVVNDGLHENIMESLFLVVEAEREIITLPIGRALAVDELFLTSVTGYVPFDQRTAKLSGHSHGMFSPQALELLRNNMDAFEEQADGRGWPKKVFLRRNSGIRKLVNSAELEQYIVSRGYEIVEPEKLTFLQQMQLFRNAKAIFAPTGAALSNAIFCRPGAQIAVLMAKHKQMIYRYWHNLLTPIGMNVGSVLGSIVENHDLGIHGDFAVDIVDVMNLLDAMESK